MTNLQQRVTATFREHHGAGPDVVVRAPGRVNLIGEHTDYNDGFVLPMAIDRAVWIALRPRGDRRVQLYSLDFEEERSYELDEYDHAPGTWLEYVQGVTWALQERGVELRGWEGVMGGDVPIGSGLSSSAALELAVARAFAAAGELAWNPAEMARVGQAAENGWVGVQCGIMDQMISAAGAADHALLIDCRSLETRLVPLPPRVRVVVLDTATRRGLVDSAYNERRRQCAAAAAHFGVVALRDVTPAEFSARAGELDETTRRRARHVITENARTLQATEAMRSGDARALGELMNASHESLRNDFEVSSPALDAMVACARAQPGCHGARMTGAGFGGCAVALVEESAAEEFLAAVAPCYRETTGRSPAIYICRATDGAAIIT